MALGRDAEPDSELLIHRVRRDWVVRIEYRDGNNDSGNKWQSLAMWSDRCVTADAAALGFIAARWELERENRQLKHFPFVSNEAALSGVKGMALVRAV